MSRKAVAISLGLLAAPALATAAQSAGLIETYEIAEDGYIYAFPMIGYYKAMYQFFIDKTSSQYKGTMNRLYNEARVFTPKDTAVVTPNSDTPYSFVGMDLRAEPMVSAYRRSRSRAITSSSSSTCTRSISATSAAARPATAPVATWSRGRPGRAKRPTASRRSSAARPTSISRSSAPSCSVRAT